MDEAKLQGVLKLMAEYEPREIYKAHGGDYRLSYARGTDMDLEPISQEEVTFLVASGRIFETKPGYYSLVRHSRPKRGLLARLLNPAAI